MTQVSKYPISDLVYQRILEIFFETLVGIKTKEEAIQFVKDFLSPTEQIMLSKRLAIVFLLEKDYDFRTIARVLRVSTTTVSHVNLMRKYGSQGYKIMIEKILSEEKVKEFLLKAGEVVTGETGKGGKGTGVWRYLNQEIKKKQFKNRKPF